MATKLKNMHLTSVDLVRAGANQEADICLYKSADGEEPQEDGIFKRFLNWFRNEGKEEPVEKARVTFDQVTDHREKQERLWQYSSALTDSLLSIRDDGELDSAGKARMMRDSLQQFNSAMEGLIAEICGSPSPSAVIGKSDPNRFDEIEEVQKFNPYHGKDGRFASANGGAASFSHTSVGNGGSAASNAELSSLKKKYGIVDVGLKDTDDKQKFADAIAAARKANPNGGAVDEHPIEELKTYKTFLSNNGMAGVAVKPDGDITAVFKNSEFQERGVVNDLILTARANGGTKMDCYGRGLVNMYEQCGYKPVARVAFNADYVSDPVLLKKRPDVYVMMKNTDSLSEVCRKNSTKAYQKSTQEALDKLPTFEYDDALKYRDGLLRKQEGGKA